MAEDPIVARLRTYIATFNRQDWAKLVDFYATDVELVIGNGTSLRGRQAIVDFYIQVNKQTTRTIEIVDAFTDGRSVVAEFKSEFLAIVDAPDFASGPMKQGDRLAINSFGCYDIGPDGRWSRVRAATFRREPKPAGGA